MTKSEVKSQCLIVINARTQIMFVPVGCLFSVRWIQRGLLEVNSLIRHGEYEKGELLFSQGDPGMYLYIVRSGRVKLYTVSAEGRQQIIRILEHGDFFGELALFQDRQQLCYAEAMEASGICLLPRDDFRALLERKPKIALSLLTAMSTRLARRKNSSVILLLRT